MQRHLVAFHSTFRGFPVTNKVNKL